MITKFKVLKYNQSLMAKLGIHSYRSNDPSNEFFRSPVIYVVSFILAAFSITSSLVFAYNNRSQFDATLEAIYIVIAALQAGGMYFSVGLKIKKVKILFKKLQTIVDEGEFFKWNFIIFFRSCEK